MRKCLLLYVVSFENAENNKRQDVSAINYPFPRLHFYHLDFGNFFFKDSLQ